MTATFFLHRSNRIEQLVEVLAGVVAQPSGDPFVPECIVVQGKGMERWLSMQLAERLGIWANPDFPFPRRLLEGAFAAVLPADEHGAARFRPETLTFVIARLLPELTDRPELAPVRSYLDADPSVARRLELAAHIARVFDGYATHRPRLVAGWEQGTDGGWQGALWRAVVATLGAGHLAARAHTFMREVGAGNGPIPGFPTRVSLFALSSLPPLYIDILAALAHRVEIHLFVPSPSREFWAEIRSHREILRTLRRAQSPIAAAGGDVDPARDLHLTQGNPLLASFGTLGRDFQQLLEGLGDYRESDRDLYRDPGAATVLATVQSDILHLHHRGTDADAPPLPYDAGDLSISLHACHSEMREIEVLHDQLLALFDADPTLAPDDIVVMTPRIDAYAPSIEAVFAGGGAPAIAFHIADRGARADPTISLFGRLLELLGGRMAASDVFDLLGEEAVRRRFAIGVDELERVRQWLDAAGIRWGVDAAHRAAHGQPPLDQNTWRLGLDRLLLGYSMADGPLFAGILPAGDAHGDDARLLGRFADYCETLFALRRELAAPRSLSRWCADLGAAFDRFVATGRGDDPSVHPRRFAHDVLAELAACADAAGFDEPIGLDAVRPELDLRLGAAPLGHGFLAGGVSFCDLVPMRSIPFRVICLVGMSDGAFPRLRRPPSFDLVAQHPKVGDRNGRDDDRYAFLEALLAARERVIVTYVGQSVRDNAELSPSVVVAELLDYLDDAFVCDDGTPVRDRLVLRHPLQPFSPRYFGADSDPRLFSYAAAYCDGAQRLVDDDERVAVPPFVRAPLATVETQSPVDLMTLEQFFTHPVKHFFRRRLGLFAPGESEPLADREPADLVGLGEWRVGEQLVVRALAGEDIAAAYPTIAAGGGMPPGNVGRCIFAEIVPAAEAIAAAARRHMGGAGPLAALDVDLELDGTRIVGSLGNLWPRGQLGSSFSKLGRAGELRLWIRHLLLNAVAPRGYPRVSHLCGRPSAQGKSVDVAFVPVPDPLPILARLIGIYRTGQTAPLPFFVRTSRRYADAWKKSGDTDRALGAAVTEYHRSGRHNAGKGEKDDSYIDLAFAAVDPFSAAPFGLATGYAFAELAEAVFAPLLESREGAP